MIAILLSPPGIDSGGLQMPVRIGAKPGIRVCGGKADGVEPVDLLPVRDAFAVGVEITPRAADPLAGNAGFGIAAVSKHCGSMSVGRCGSGAMK